MKTKTIISTVAVLLLMTSFSIAQNKKTTDKDCLELSVSILIGNEPFEGATIKVYEGNNVLYTIDDENASKYQLTLKENSYYTFEISYADFVTRRVAVSTKMPSGLKHELVYQHDLSISMIAQDKVKKQDDFDFPAGMITYNAKTDLFESNKGYVASLKSDKVNSGRVVASR